MLEIRNRWAEKVQDEFEDAIIRALDILWFDPPVAEFRELFANLPDQRILLNIDYTCPQCGERHG